MSAPAPRTCDECGAPLDERSCRECFDVLLALEFEHPPAFGAVHHLTVACYSLQHPAGYNRAALEMWRSLVADALDGRATPAELLRRSAERFEGARRVREPGAQPPDWWPRAWPVHVAEVVPPPGEDDVIAGHTARVRRWAAGVRAALDAGAPTDHQS